MRVPEPTLPHRWCHLHLGGGASGSQFAAATGNDASSGVVNAIQHGNAAQAINAVPAALRAPLVAALPDPG